MGRGGGGVVAGLDAYRSGLAGLRGGLIWVGVFSAVINVLMLTGPLYMLQVYDRVLASGSVSTLLGLFAIVVVLYAFQGFYEFLRTRLLSRASYRLDAAVSGAAFELWVGQEGRGQKGGGQKGGGQPLRDLDVVRGFLSGPAVLGLVDAPWVPLYVAVMFVIHPWLGWLTVAGAVVVAVAALVNQAMTQGTIGRAMGLDGAERFFVEQARRQAETITALGMLEQVRGRWRLMHEAALAQGQLGGDRSEGVGAFSKTFRLFLQSALLTLGAYLVLRQEISAGMIVASSILAGRALAPVDQIIGQWRGIGRALEAHRRLGESFADLPAARPRIGLPAPTGALEAIRLTKFAPGAGPLAERARILSGVSFALAAGDGLGVIGNSASGKSSLARLIVGAWTADLGELRLDGATPDQWHPSDLGRHIGYLPQALEMLPGTVKDNIARFDPQAQDEAVIEAARIAGVHEMILRLPDGYATRLGGAEQPLSGGQIQRLGLARAIFGAPRIIVLDEPNSNLDISGDAALANAITVMRGKGSVVIVMAHRPSAIAAVNKVMILHNGTMVQFGDKEEVLAAAAAGPGSGPAAAAPSVPAPVPVAAGGRQKG